MASMKLGIDTRSIDEQGMCPVRMRINNNKTSAYVYIGVRVEPAMWTGDTDIPLRRGAFMRQEKAEHILAWVERYDRAIFSLKANDELDGMTANQLRDYVSGVKEKPVVEKMVASARSRRSTDTKRVTFLKFLDVYAAGRNSKKSREDVEYVGRLIGQYMSSRHMTVLDWEDITYEQICNISRYVTDDKGLGAATRFKVESYIRAVYREAERRKIVSRENDPFYDYKIKPVPVGEIEVIPIDVMRRFVQYDLTNEPGIQSMTMARDMLLMSFFCCGANFMDIYHTMNVDGDEVVFVRHKVGEKTARPVRIRIEPEMLEILKRHPIGCMRGVKYETIQRRINDRCDLFGKRIEGKVNMRLLRHTWATYAGELGVPKDVVDHSIGKVEHDNVDIHYRRYDWSLTAEANRKVMDYVLYGITSDSPIRM